MNTTGYVAAAYFVGALLLTVALGRAADRFGRRKVLLWGAFSSSLFMAMFGFSVSFPMALIARLFWGLSSGSFVVALTVCCFDYCCVAALLWVSRS